MPGNPAPFLFLGGFELGQAEFGGDVFPGYLDWHVDLDFLRFAVDDVRKHADVLGSVTKSPLNPTIWERGSNGGTPVSTTLPCPPHETASYL